jgi:hypothetical protein
MEDTIEDYEWAKLSGKMLKTGSYSDDRKEVVTRDMKYSEWKAALHMRQSLKDIVARRLKK